MGFVGIPQVQFLHTSKSHTSSVFLGHFSPLHTATAKYSSALDYHQQHNQTTFTTISPKASRRSSLSTGCRVMAMTATQAHDDAAAETNIGVSQRSQLTPAFDALPTMSDILGVANGRGVRLELQSFGPFFQVRAMALDTQEYLGSANGFIKVWLQGRILHLESIKMRKASEKMSRFLFGLSLLIGAVVIRHGYNHKCTKAELLAINDNELMHEKLVRYYSRMGFKPVHEVTGESLNDLPHMLAWGGVGLRMDADILYLLKKWSKAFINK